MNLIEKPSVYLVGRQQIVQGELDRFLSDHGVAWQTDSEVGAEVLSEAAGRVCYMSFAKPRPGGNAAYLGHIKEVGHGSVLEHAVWNLLLTGISRSLSHELVRHRAGLSPSQLSQRYVDESVADFVIPPDLRDEVRCALFRRLLLKCKDLHEAVAAFPDVADIPTRLRDNMALYGEVWLTTVEQTQAGYVCLADYLSDKAKQNTPDGTPAPEGGFKTQWRKYARQAARSVLPNATETKVFITVNGRAARHFIELRASRHADPEIRNLGYAIWQTLAKEAPNFFSDYSEVRLPDGTVELTTSHRKV